jgi:hypothetical protein
MGRVADSDGRALIEATTQTTQYTTFQPIPVPWRTMQGANNPPTAPLGEQRHGAELHARKNRQKRDIHGASSFAFQCPHVSTPVHHRKA